MVAAEIALYTLARLFYRTEVAHSSGMKHALKDKGANSVYRSEEIARVVDAMRRLGVTIAGKDILDLGCNDGALTTGYLSLDPRSIIGCDIDRAAIERAAQSHKVPNLWFRASSKTKLPVDDNSVDVILSCDVFEHVAQPSDILGECRRVLRPGGQLLLGTWGWRHPFAPHLWATMPVPWAHMLVSERTLLAACRRVYESSWYEPTYYDLDENGARKPDRYSHTAISTDYLNKYLVRDFERTFAESGMSYTVDLQPFSSRWASWTAPLLGNSFTREFLHGYLWAVLKK